MFTSAKANRYRVLGLMSGTSLDGLDLAMALFWKEDDQWKFILEAGQTRKYPPGWQKKLAGARNLSPSELDALSVEYAKFMAQEAKEFISALGGVPPDLVTSHGHTVHHRPQEGVTLQIGDGNTLHLEIKIPVVCNFRKADVEMGGQGAPLVPLGDALLFWQYPACLNLGGFSNISFDCQGKRIAFDMCAVNVVLNLLAQKLDLPYDDGGQLAQSGNVHQALFDRLNKIDFYQAPPPKSLGVEWVDQYVWPVLNDFSIPVKDKICTYTHHIAQVLSNDFSRYNLPSVLVTGGGAHNRFLISLLQKYSSSKLHLPSKEVIEYKEALVFGFLGLLRNLGEINVLASVTGAGKDHSSGDIFC